MIRCDLIFIDVGDRACHYRFLYATARRVSVFIGSSALVGMCGDKDGHGVVAIIDIATRRAIIAAMNGLICHRGSSGDEISACAD